MTGIAKYRWMAAAMTMSMLVACGGGSGQSNATKTGGAAVVAQGVDPTTMDPDQQRETTTVNVLRHLYDPLVERDPKNPTNFRGVLAISWLQVNPTTLRFKLHSNVKFTDGKTFDAQTVKYNFDRVLGNLPGGHPTLNAYLYPTVDHAAVVDASSVDIVTKAPDPILLARLTDLLIIPTGSVDSDPNALGGNPDGTGPYSLVRWDRNNQVVLRAKPDYFLGAAKIALVTFKTMPDASSRLAALQAGTVDIITNVPPDNIADAESGGKATVKSVPSDRVAGVWLDTLTSPALGKQDVREALNYAVDVDTIIKTVLGGYALRTATIVPPYFTGYNPDVKPFSYDPAKAKALLTQAGYPNGLTIHMMLPRGRYLLGEEIVQAIAGYLQKVGVQVKIDDVEFGVFAKATQTRKIQDTFYAAYGESFLDAAAIMQVTVVTGTKGFSWYSNPAVDQDVAQASATADQAKHVKLLQDAQMQLRENPAFIYLFAYKDLYGVSKRINWQPRTDELIDLYDASVK